MNAALITAAPGIPKPCTKKVATRGLCQARPRPAANDQGLAKQAHPHGDTGPRRASVNPR